MSVLAEYLQTEADAVRSESARMKEAKLDWQRAAQELVTQLIEWLSQADQQQVLRVRQTDHTFEDYDVGRYVIKGLSITMRQSTVSVTPSNLEIAGSILLPDGKTRRRIDGRFEFDNSMDRRNLYRVRDGDRDVWLWWGHGAVGIPFDRESFEAAVVSMLQ